MEMSNRIVPGALKVRSVVTDNFSLLDVWVKPMVLVSELHAMASCNNESVGCNNTSFGTSTVLSLFEKRINIPLYPGSCVVTIVSVYGVCVCNTYGASSTNGSFILLLINTLTIPSDNAPDCTKRSEPSGLVSSK